MNDWDPFAYRDTLDEVLKQQRRMRELLDPPLRRWHKQLKEQTQLVDTERIRSSLCPTIREATLASHQIVESLSSPRQIKQLGEGLNSVSTLKASELRLASITDDAIQATLRAQAAQVKQLSLAAAQLISGVDWDRFGRDLLVPVVTQEALHRAAEELTAHFHDLITSLSSSVAAGLPPTLGTLPALELFFAGDLAHSWATPPESEQETPVEIRQVRERAQGETATSLETLLADLDPDLLVLLKGARLALRGSNPDRARHVSTSLRELLTHVLRRIAPDAEVKAWAPTPEHLHDGRPTRRARLLYVVATVNYGPLSKFLETDVQAALTFLDVCQGGTHSSCSRLSDEQLAVMVVRMEGLLRFLLEMWQLQAR